MENNGKVKIYVPGSFSKRQYQTKYLIVPINHEYVFVSLKEDREVIMLEKTKYYNSLNDEQKIADIECFWSLVNKEIVKRSSYISKTSLVASHFRSYDFTFLPPAAEAKVLIENYLAGNLQFLATRVIQDNDTNYYFGLTDDYIADNDFNNYTSHNAIRLSYWLYLLEKIKNKNLAELTTDELEIFCMYYKVIKVEILNATRLEEYAKHLFNEIGSYTNILTKTIEVSKKILRR